MGCSTHGSLGTVIDAPHIPLNNTNHLVYALKIYQSCFFIGRCHGIGKSRDKLCDSLGLAETLRPDVPLLSEILRLSKVTVLRSETPTLSEDVSHK